MKLLSKLFEIPLCFIYQSATRKLHAKFTTQLHEIVSFFLDGSFLKKKKKVNRFESFVKNCKM